MSLLNHDMLFVTGKGGVGKTTVAAAIALAAARRGLRTIVCEFGEQARVPALLGVAPGAPDEEVQVAERLWATTIDSFTVLEEWIARILQSRALTHLLVRSNFFRAFAEAAPGGHELGEIVKTWELAQERRWQRRARRYDLVVVDGPASGHAIGMLRTPSTFADIARVGPIASQSVRVRDWLRDAGRTAFVAVALPAELPVSETLDLEARLHESLGRGMDAIVVNGLLPDRFGDGELEALAARVEPAHAALIEELRAAEGRADAQREHLARLRARAAAPVAELPFVFAPALERAHVEALANGLPLA